MAALTIAPDPVQKMGKGLVHKKAPNASCSWRNTCIVHCNTVGLDVLPWWGGTVISSISIGSLGGCESCCAANKLMDNCCCSSTVLKTHHAF